jgi:hypothetical protein
MNGLFSKRTMAALGIFLIMLLAGAAGIYFLVHHFYDRDVQALNDFKSAYTAYDQAITAAAKTLQLSDDLKQTAGQALADMQARASVRISSFIKNDGELMNTEQEIAALSGKEMDALQMYQAALVKKSADIEQRKKELDDLTSQRQAAYLHFQELGRLGQ